MSNDTNNYPRPYFFVFGLNREIYISKSSYSVRIGKERTRKSENMDTFKAVLISVNDFQKTESVKSCKKFCKIDEMFCELTGIKLL